MACFHLSVVEDNVFLTAEGMLRIGDFGVTINSDDFEDGNEGDAVRALVHRDFPAPLLCARARRRRRIAC